MAPSLLKTRGATVTELTWENYVWAISSQFSNAMFEDPMEEISSIIQDDDLHEYNNAIDAHLNKKLQCSVKDIPSLNVSVAGRKQLQCNQMCPDFQWTMQGPSSRGVTLPWQELVCDFQEVFQPPKSLPPERPFDHRIILKEGTTPISQCPYRYPAVQKDIIERTTRER
nr:putative mitochondrial protein [Tanacetum cinerariifolium]